MIHYHGIPITPEAAAAQILMRRHAMVSFAHPEQIELVADTCQSFALDNGAFSAWRSGTPIIDWTAFYGWVKEWQQHPGFDWFLIPDVIDGTEAENDGLVSSSAWSPYGVPVWHLHESLDRIERLIAWGFHRIAIGSSDSFAQIGTRSWWRRMAEAMTALCDVQGRPRVKLHGLRMLDPQVFACFPFASADSTNVARNIGLDSRWTGSYPPATKTGRGVVLAERIEAFNSPSLWRGLRYELCSPLPLFAELLTEAEEQP
jgi:hypothetical protein